MTLAVQTRGGPLYESGLIEEAGEGLLRPGGLALTERAIATCQLPPGARLLDLGCGAGATVAHLRRTHGLAAIGLDRSRLLLGRARLEATDAPLIHADGAALPLRSGSVDAVLMECFLSVTPDPARVLRECWRILAPGGCLAMTDLYVRAAATASGRPSQRPGCFSGIATREELLGALAAQGFEVRRWEDHSRSLTLLAARLVMTHGSLTPLWEHACGVEGQASALEDRVRCARPGYFLLVASKATGTARAGTEGEP